MDNWPIIIHQVHNIDWYTVIANFIMAIASIANLGIIIWFYNRDKSDRNEMRKKQSDLYWFRTIILEKNIDLIYHFIDMNVEIVEECRVLLGSQKNPMLEKDFKSFFGKHAEEKNNLNNSFVDTIRIINKDFGQEIQDKLNNFQDKFTQSLADWKDKQLKDGYTNSYNIIYDFKEELIRDLYNYEHSLV